MIKAQLVIFLLLLSNTFSSPYLRGNEELTFFNASAGNDPVEWITFSDTEAHYWTKIIYWLGKLVAISGTEEYPSNKVAYSVDGGNSWTIASMPTCGNWVSLAGNSKLIAISSNSTIAYSQDAGKTWTKLDIPLPQASDMREIVYAANGTFYIVTGETALYSNDGTNWYKSHLIEGDWKAAAVGNNRIVTISKAACCDTPNSAMLLTNSTSSRWIKGNLQSGYEWWDLEFGKDRFVAMARSANGSATNIGAFSGDGLSWELFKMPISEVWEEVVFGGGMFIIYSKSGKAVYSTNGSQWSELCFPHKIVSNAPLPMAFAGSQFVGLNFNHTYIGTLVPRTEKSIIS